jgi:hypothetical protein
MNAAKILAGAFTIVAMTFMVTGLFIASTADAKKNFTPHEFVTLKVDGKQITYYRFKIPESEYGPELSCLAEKKSDLWRCRVAPWSAWAESE